MPEPAADNNHADDHGLGVVETGRHVNWRNHAEMRAKGKAGAKKAADRLQNKGVKMPPKRNMVLVWPRGHLTPPSPLGQPTKKTALAAVSGHQARN
ncbi:MAG TPA: hypothetical protein VL357_00260 [Rariglobus sp.]|jgi:hypothetical protein|nr:hypothetical protein [Rariglobus sp.]